MSHESLHKDIDTTRICGVGLGMPFALRFWQRIPTLGRLVLCPVPLEGLWSLNGPRGLLITKIWWTELMLPWGVVAISKYFYGIRAI